jgi:ubiquinone/menaquinone biosynthesis C-methylase UbiE
MLAEATCLGNAPHVEGDALALPFSSRAFDLVALVTTLEFLPEPVRALSEASRVARKGLILGTLNRQSLLGRSLKREGGPIWGIARFFTLGKLIEMVQAAVGKRARIVWRTTLWPAWPAVLPLPWGGFIGMAVRLAGP